MAVIQYNKTVQNNNELQHIDGFEEQKQQLDERAERLVQSALFELRENPGQKKDIFKTYSDIIRHEIFGNGCLGPGTAAANPDPFLEKLGAACGVFKEVKISEGLTLEKLVKSAFCTAAKFEEKSFFICTGIEADQNARSFTTENSPEEIIEKLIAQKVTKKRIVYFDIQEPCFDIFRCRVLYDCKDGVLIIRGTNDFVDNVLDAVNLG